jgi:hypothetical protein
MKKILLTVVLFPLAYAAVAQLTKIDDVKKQLETTNKDTVAWTYGGVLNFGVNEGFLHNWAAGGEVASLTVNSIFSGHLERLHHRDIWSNNLDMTYGLNYDYSQAFIPHKTDDRIDFTSKYGIRLDSSKHYYFTTLFNFKSQFTKGYDYTRPNWDSFPTSKFMSPAYFTLAAGAEYREGSDISFFLSPLAGRLTTASRYYTDQSPQGAFGVAYNKTTYYQLGAYFSGRYVIQIKKNMVFKTRLDLYSDYLAKDTKDSTGKVIKRDNPGNISVLFDNLFSWKISKYFNITTGLTFIYDNNIPYSNTYVNSAGETVSKNVPGQGLGWLQTKQIFTFGMEYKF